MSCMFCWCYVNSFDYVKFLITRFTILGEKAGKIYSLLSFGGLHGCGTACYLFLCYMDTVMGYFHPVLTPQREQKHACYLWRFVSVMLCYVVKSERRHW